MANLIPLVCSRFASRACPSWMYQEYFNSEVVWNTETKQWALRDWMLHRAAVWLFILCWISRVVRLTIKIMQNEASNPWKEAEESRKRQRRRWYCLFLLFLPSVSLCFIYLSSCVFSVSMKAFADAAKCSRWRDMQTERERGRMWECWHARDRQIDDDEQGKEKWRKGEVIVFNFQCVSVCAPVCIHGWMFPNVREGEDRKQTQCTLSVAVIYVMQTQFITWFF